MCNVHAYITCRHRNRIALVQQLETLVVVIFDTWFYCECAASVSDMSETNSFGVMPPTGSQLGSQCCMVFESCFLESIKATRTVLFWKVVFKAYMFREEILKGLRRHLCINQSTKKIPHLITRSTALHIGNKPRTHILHEKTGRRPRQVTKP